MFKKNMKIVNKYIKMFNADKKRVKACIEYDDYYSALIYINLIIERYNNNEKIYFELIRKNIKSGKYQEIKI